MVSIQRGLGVLAFLLNATAACRGPCTPPPPCETPNLPLANAEAGEELGGRAHWYANVDAAGPNQAEPLSAFVAGAGNVTGGASGTQRAARISGTFTSSADAVAVLGLRLDHRALAEIGSRSVGIRFWSKSGAGSAAKARFTVTCADADSFARDIPVFEEWTEFGVPFKALKPLPANRSSTLDPARIVRIEWRLLEPAGKFDLAIDEVVVLGCMGRVLPTSCYAG